MQSKAQTVEAYFQELPEDRKEAMSRLRTTILENLPKGFAEIMSYGMVGYVVPHELYPAGYHCNPEQPLPFLGMASQKNAISFYHMGIYTNPELLDWFVQEYPKHCSLKLDMGKSCVRFKKPDKIPFDLIGELVRKMSPEQWIEIYEKEVKRK